MSYFCFICRKTYRTCYNSDTIIVGKIIGTQALAAVGTTGPLNFLVLGFASGITSGFAVLVAQRFGAGDEKGMKKAVAAAVELAAAFTVLLTLLATFGAKGLLRLINSSLSELRLPLHQYLLG